MKKIWFLSAYSVPPELGPWIRHYKFSENLIDKGYKTVIFSASHIHNTKINMIKSSNSYQENRFGKVPFIFIRTTDYVGNGRKRVQSMFEYTLRLLKVSNNIDIFKPDIIYASSAHPLTWISGYLLSKKYKAKFIAETRDLWPETLVAMGRLKKNSIVAKILYSLESFIYKNADRLVFTFPGGKDYVSEIGIDNSKVRYVNNGIDIEKFKSNQNNNYNDVKLDDKELFKVVYTGSMGQANELKYLLDAAKIVNNNNSNIVFLLFGDGYQKEELERYTKDKKINNVIFKGQVESKYIPNILSKSNLNVFTGKHSYLYKYGLSLNKMFEYFCSGKPTISNIETSYDLLSKYKAGITVSGGNSKALADGILKFYKMEKDEYEIYCRNAEEAAKNFDYKKLTDKLEEIIYEL